MAQSIKCSECESEFEPVGKSTAKKCKACRRPCGVKPGSKFSEEHKAKLRVAAQARWERVKALLELYGAKS